ncbi:MAG: luciferase family protein [Candidatus Bathyarchaeia archaeon]
MAISGLVRRNGERPKTTSTNPHKQLTQNSPVEIYKKLADRIFSLPGVEENVSMVSVPGARALWLSNDASISSKAFMKGREFAHLHPPEDGSLHLSLPPQLVEHVIEKGWAEPHPVAMMGFMPANVVMVYAPRNENEIEIVYNIVVVSYQFAKGELS